MFFKQETTRLSIPHKINKLVKSKMELLSFFFQASPPPFKTHTHTHTFTHRLRRKHVLSFTYIYTQGFSHTHTHRCTHKAKPLNL